MCRTPSEIYRRSQRRRARKLLPELIKRDGMDCHYCWKPMELQIPFDNEERLSIEHLVPLVEGGTSTIENLVLAHQSCQNEVNLKSQGYIERTMEFNRTHDEFEEFHKRQTALA